MVSIIQPMGVLAHASKAASALPRTIIPRRRATRHAQGARQVELFFGICATTSIMLVTKNTATPKTRRLTFSWCPLEKMMVKKKVSLPFRGNAFGDGHRYRLERGTTVSKQANESAWPTPWLANQRETDDKFLAQPRGSRGPRRPAHVHRFGRKT